MLDPAGASLGPRPEAPSAACSADRAAGPRLPVPWGKLPSTLALWAATGRSVLSSLPDLLAQKPDYRNKVVTSLFSRALPPCPMGEPACDLALWMHFGNCAQPGLVLLHAACKVCAGSGLFPQRAAADRGAIHTPCRDVAMRGSNSTGALQACWRGLTEGIRCMQEWTRAETRTRKNSAQLRTGLLPAVPCTSPCYLPSMLWESSCQLGIQVSLGSSDSV